MRRIIPRLSHAIAAALLTCAAGGAGIAADWPANLPVYDHIVIVIEENKDFEQILGDRFDAPYLKQLAPEGASFSRMFGEEHYSQGNYFWLFSGSNQNVGFFDQVPSTGTIRSRPAISASS
jgi:phosphatidylinositol-3-phosphatase